LAFHSGREADHSTPSSAEVKQGVELYLHSPNTPSWRRAQLGGAQGQGQPKHHIQVVLSFVLRIREIPGPNVGIEAGYRNSWLSSVPSDKRQHNI
jgi:hypothetical protein